MLAALAIFSFRSAWNDFLWPLIAVNKPEMFPLPVALALVNPNRLDETDVLAMFGDRVPASAVKRFQKSVTKARSKDSVRALAPVYLGDTIRPEAVIVEKRETKKPDQGIWALNYTVRNQDDVDVMTFTSRKLVFKRPAGGDTGQAADAAPSPVAHV